MSGWLVAVIAVAYVGLNFIAQARLIDQLHALAKRVVDLEQRR